jgi:hypothetical protein
MAVKRSGAVRKSIPSGKTSQAQDSAVTGESGTKTSRPLEAGLEAEIRRRAYELYEARGRGEGLDQEEWNRAEAEVLSRRRGVKSASA